MKYLCSLIILCLLLLPFGVNAVELVDTDKTNCKIWNQVPRSNGIFSWSGECVNGYASGSGTEILYQNGKETERYEGQIKMGKFNGRGTFTYGPNSPWAGDKYEGEFVDGKRNGKGTYTYANGDKYEGDFVNGRRNGKGTYTCGPKSKWAGDKYEGDFVDGNFHGRGTYTYANGDKYVGDYVDDRRNGKGTYTCSNGKQFTGNFENDKPVGLVIICN